MLAKINGLFRLTRDLEMQYTAGGVAVAKIGIACSEKYKDNENQLFLDAKAFAKPAEILQQYAGTKGTQIFLTGKLQTESWDDSTTGQKRSKTVMIIEGFDFVSNGQNTGHSTGQQQTQTPMGQGVAGGQNSGHFQQQMQAPQQRAPQYAPNDFDIDAPF